MEAVVNDNNSLIINLADLLELMNKQIEAVADKVDSVDIGVLKLEKENEYFVISMRKCTEDGT